MFSLSHWCRLNRCYIRVCCPARAVVCILAPCAPDGSCVQWRQADCGGAELHVEFTVAGDARRGSERLLRGMAAVASLAGASELLSIRIARRGGTCVLY